MCHSSYINEMEPESPPTHLSSGDQAQYEALWLPQQVYQHLTTYMRTDSEWFRMSIPNTQWEAQFPKSHREGRGKDWPEVGF